MSYDEIYSKLKNVGQEQLLDFYDELNDEEKEIVKDAFLLTIKTGQKFYFWVIFRYDKSRMKKKRKVLLHR